MSEERAAAAALAIERYVAGLRDELGPLGAAEAADLTREINDMLLDAAREDPELAFSEMQRLGEPSGLAATLLAERGIAIGGGIPAAAWWRLGIAATVDILVGVAAPVIVAIASYAPMMQAVSGPTESGAGPWARIGTIAALLAVFALTLVLAWRSWTPWRDGGRSSTPGMALARIAVVRIGGSRAVVGVADLAAAGLESPSLAGTPAGSAVASVLLAALVLFWSASMISDGAFHQSGADVVARFAGPTDSYEIQIVSASDQLYGAAEMGGLSWPVISGDELDTAALKDSLVKRFQTTDQAATGEFTVGQPTSIGTGAWIVHVAEQPTGGTARTVLLTWEFRLQWIGGDSGPSADWVLTDYKPVQ